jgi:hypothetical protein
MRSGGTPNLASDAGFVECLVAHRVVPADVRADQLGQVLVAGGDQGVDAGLRRRPAVASVPITSSASTPSTISSGQPAALIAAWSGSICGPDRPASAGGGPCIRVPVVAEGLALGVEDDGLVVRLVVALQTA